MMVDVRDIQDVNILSVPVQMQMVDDAPDVPDVNVLTDLNPMPVVVYAPADNVQNRT